MERRKRLAQPNRGELAPDYNHHKNFQKNFAHWWANSEIDQTLPHSGDTSQKIHCATYYETENNPNPLRLLIPKSREPFDYAQGKLSSRRRWPVGIIVARCDSLPSVVSLLPKTYPHLSASGRTGSNHVNNVKQKLKKDWYCNPIRENSSTFSWKVL